jgi:hypothetical protein
VPPGKWGTNIVFWSKATKTEEDEDGGEVEKDIHFMRTYTVFNIDQIEGSGARPVDQEVVDYVEARIVEPIRRGSPQWTDQDLANVEALLRYLRTHLGTTAEDKDGSFHDSDLQTVTYGEVREAQPDPFSFSVVGDDAVAVAQVLAQGIDAHWEACLVEARGGSLHVPPCDADRHAERSACGDGAVRPEPTAAFADPKPDETSRFAAAIVRAQLWWRQMHAGRRTFLRPVHSRLHPATCLTDTTQGVGPTSDPFSVFGDRP